MTDRCFWAHSARDENAEPDSREGWQLLAAHLENVSRIAADLARLARPQDERFVALAALSGALHDYGKYFVDFQKMLTNRGKKGPQHAIHGAQLAFFGVGSEDAERPLLRAAAWAIAGHHAGLADHAGGSGTLMTRLKDDKHREEMLKLVSIAKTDSPLLRRVIEEDLPNLRVRPRVPAPEYSHLDLFTRMLFSCLVDADRLDTAGRSVEQLPLDAKTRLDALLAHLTKLSESSREGNVKEMRARVLRDCLDAADSSARLFSLSVPTGGGKTLASMAFALQRAVLMPDSFRRVIVVIPYLSIIEQNARVYTEIFGADAILEHHSGSHVALRRETAELYVADKDKDDEQDEGLEFQKSGQRTATENWDAPIVVTTSVRFFESLFSNRPRDLRRVHNIARSIVILDEVQTLPRELLEPLLGMMRELSENWGVNFVFSTATQPAFERPATISKSADPARWEPGALTEIIRDPAAMRAALKRAVIRWEIDQPVNWEQVAGRMLAAPSSLTIVNLRDHAGELYQIVKRQAGERGLEAAAVFHLSTRMCAAHRLRVLDVIRARLQASEPCWVVSTQLIEAGVDVDFPLVLRALGPLDSIIQAAGRADREGKRTALLGVPGGEVVVFLPEDHRTPPNGYKEATGLTEQIVQQAAEDGEAVGVDSEAVATYFERYYGERPKELGRSLMSLRLPHQDTPFDIMFKTLAQKFEMISNRTRDVFVPDDPEAKAALEELRSEHYLTAGLRRRLQRHTVGLNPSEFEKARQYLGELTKDSEIWIASGVAYHDELGLRFQPEAGKFVLGSSDGG